MIDPMLPYITLIITFVISVFASMVENASADVLDDTNESNVRHVRIVSRVRAFSVWSLAVALIWCGVDFITFIFQ